MINVFVVVVCMYGRYSPKLWFPSGWTMIVFLYTKVVLVAWIQGKLKVHTIERCHTFDFWCDITVQENEGWHTSFIPRTRETISLFFCTRGRSWAVCHRSWGNSSHYNSSCSKRMLKREKIVSLSLTETLRLDVASSLLVSSLVLLLSCCNVPSWTYKHDEQAFLLRWARRTENSRAREVRLKPWTAPEWISCLSSLMTWLCG